MEKRKKVQVRINPLIYALFRKRCKLLNRKPNETLEALMLAFIKQPVLIKIVERIIEENKKRSAF